MWIRVVWTQLLDPPVEQSAQISYMIVDSFLLVEKLQKETCLSTLVKTVSSCWPRLLYQWKDDSKMSVGQMFFNQKMCNHLTLVAKLIKLFYHNCTNIGLASVIISGKCTDNCINYGQNVYNIDTKFMKHFWHKMHHYWRISKTLAEFVPTVAYKVLKRLLWYCPVNIIFSVIWQVFNLL